MILRFVYLFMPFLSFAAAWLVVASFPSASTGSSLPHTDVPSVEHQSALLKHSERKAAGENLKLKLSRHQTLTGW